MMMLLKNIVLFFEMVSLLHTHFVSAETIRYYESGNHNLLAADLYHTIAQPLSAENFIFSPIPIETTLTMAFTGAEGKTAEELRHVLRLGAEDRARVTQNFGEFLKSLLIQSNAETKSPDPELYIANRLYASDHFKISPDFNRMAKENFDVSAENINFAERKLSTAKINNYVEQNTQNKIKSVLLEDDMNANTNMIVVNGLYFKGKWKYAFSEKDIKSSSFQLNDIEKIPAEMMHIRGTFNYVDLPELEASALELPFNRTGLVLTLILPYKIEGLQKLEEKLKALEFGYIPTRLAPKKVCAYVPKFQMEHEIDLKQPLEKIGLKTLFSEKAELPGMFDSPSSQYISSFKQKILFEIDEKGAVPAPDDSGRGGECGKDIRVFYADHPFIFAVRSNAAVYFAGHIAKL